MHQGILSDPTGPLENKAVSKSVSLFVGRVSQSISRSVSRLLLSQQVNYQSVFQSSESVNQVEVIYLTMVN